MTQRPDDLTQPIPNEPDAVPAPAADAAAPGPTPDWARPSTGGDVPASDLPVMSRAAPATGYPVPVASAATPVATTTSWRSRLGRGKGLAVGALVVGLGLGAVGGSVATWAVVHDAPGGGTTADGRGFDHDGDGRFGRPDGDRGGFPPGGGQRPGGDEQQGGGGSSGSGTDANGTSQAT